MKVRPKTMSVCIQQSEEAALPKICLLIVIYLMFLYLMVHFSYDTHEPTAHLNLTGSVYYTEQLDQVPTCHRSLVIDSTVFLLPTFNLLGKTVHSNEDHFKSTTIVTSEDQIKALLVAYYMAYHCVNLETALNRFSQQPWSITELQLEQLKYWSNTMICV